MFTASHAEKKIGKTPLVAHHLPTAKKKKGKNILRKNTWAQLFVLLRKEYTIRGDNV